MRVFESKRIFKKFIIIVLFFILFSFFNKNFVQTTDEDDGGNILLGPVTNLFVSIADSAMSVIQEILLQNTRRRRRIINKNK